MLIGLREEDHPVFMHSHLSFSHLSYSHLSGENPGGKIAIPAIVDKLNPGLTEPISTGRQVVYILAKIRKLLKLD